MQWYSKTYVVEPYKQSRYSLVSRGSPSSSAKLEQNLRLLPQIIWRIYFPCSRIYSSIGTFRFISGLICGKRIRPSFSFLFGRHTEYRRYFNHHPPQPIESSTQPLICVRMVEVSVCVHFHQVIINSVNFFNVISTIFQCRFI